MNLSKKKELAKRTFGVGKDRIKQDIRDLEKDGAIIIKEVGGRKKVREKSRRGRGNIKKVTRVRKRDYMILARKLRKHASEMKKSGILTKENLEDLRKKIRNKAFRSKSHLKEYIGEMKK